MNIVIFSINPIFPNLVTGGASKHLYQIASHLGAIGHTVNLICAAPREQLDSFYWSENVLVTPTLPFHLPFPQPYAISGPDLTLIVSRVHEALQNADRFYIHDGEFLFPDVYESIPTTSSFRDNIYPESVLGSFIGKADDIICISDFSCKVIGYSVGQFYPDIYKRIHKVINGLDLEVFHPVDSSSFAKKIGIDRINTYVLLHPHRPEPGKGLKETILVVDTLVHKYGIKEIKVLIPQWINSMVSMNETSYAQKMKQLIEELDLMENFISIPWLPIDKMAQLYSLGDVTLCLGNFVETFGNVAYESLACGTPSIVAKVGVHRTQMPDELIDKVDPGDYDGVAERIVSIFEGREFRFDAIKETIEKIMNVKKQKEGYASVITQSKKRKYLRFSPTKVTEKTHLILAPWCYLDGNKVFHDFRGIFTEDKLFSLLFNRREKINLIEAKQAGVSDEKWQYWVDQTWLVPEIVKNN